MNKFSKKFIRRVAAPLVLAIATAAGAAAQTFVKPQPWLLPDGPPPAGPVAPLPKQGQRAPAVPGETTEKSIKVDSKINLTMDCVTEGSIKINGWRRNEVRMLVRDGSKFEFKVVDKSPTTGAPIWIKVVGVDPRKRPGPTSDCLAAGEISIDVPATAIVKLKGREISTSVDSVDRVEIRSVGGDISVRNVANGVSASAGIGDVTVESSKGPMSLETTSGNILVFEAGPSEIADPFTAKTSNGAVALQNLQFRQVSVNSTTGSLAYVGAIRNGATYDMRTLKGSIKLTVPPASSFQFSATYAFGEFGCELPVDLTTERVAPGSVKTVSGKVGKGDGMLKLATTNGSINIRKL